MDDFVRSENVENVTVNFSETFEIEPLNFAILGLKWNVEDETLEVTRGPQKVLPEIVTQRAVLSNVSSVFDPLGVFAPFTMRIQILLKNNWKCNGQEWDKKLSEEETKLSKKGLKNYTKLEILLCTKSMLLRERTTSTTCLLRRLPTCNVYSSIHS